MKKNSILLILILLINIGCKDKIEKRSKIEIYTLNKRIKTWEGISSKQVLDANNPDHKYLLDSLQDLPNYDTIKKEFIYAGRFNVSNEDLNDVPLISENEILSLDTLNKEIVISESGVIKLLSLKKDLKGIQFVICENREPIFSGYFWSVFSSYGVRGNFILYDKKQKENIAKFPIFKGNGYEMKEVEKVNLKEYPSLVSSFVKNKKITQVNN